MIQTSIFKPIKDKQTRFLYESIAHQLNYIETLSTVDALDGYIKRVLAYLNGFTEKNKLFKDLRKTHQIHPNLYIRWLIEFAKFKIHYTQYPNIKRLDDLMLFAERQSTFSYLLLITDKNASDHIKIIGDLAKVDILSHVLLNADTLKKNNQIHFPTQLIEDYHLEESLDGSYMINERYIALWEMIAYKIKVLSEGISLAYGLFNESEAYLIEAFTKTRFKELNSHLKKKYTV